MSGFQILDLLIGVFFVFFLLSLICSALQEIRARFWNLRSENLSKWITDTFNKDFGEKLLNNIIIDGLTQSGRSASYLTKEIFIRALLEEIHNDKKTDEDDNYIPPGKSLTYDFQSLESAIRYSHHLPKKMKAGLLQLHSESFQNIDQFKEKLGIWFDQAMERNAGAFKRDAQSWILIFSIVVSVGMNVDALKLMRYFYENPAATKELANAAEQMTKDPETIKRVEAIIKSDSAELSADVKDFAANVSEIKKYKTQLETLQLPIGWDLIANSKSTLDGWFWLKTLCGWIITILAVSLGAPFWFDMLNKLVDLRSAGKKPSPVAATTTHSETTHSTENILG